MNQPTDNTPTLDRRCTLVLPGLLDLPEADRADAFSQLGRQPELEWYFSRAQRRAFSGADLETVLFGLFSVALSADADVPVGSVTYLGDTGSATTGYCLRADPVQLIPDRDQLVLMDSDSLSLSQAEANLLVQELNAQFAEDGWRIEACTPMRWYLHLADAPKLRTYRLQQVHGQSIAEYLPLGEDGKRWQRIMNEVQMILHSSAVNQDRQTTGQPAVTSLWFWGGGETPVVQHSSLSKVWSNEPVSLGLAALSSTPRKPLPENAKIWLNDAISPGEHLLVLDDLSRAWQSGSISEWAQQVNILNREWIAPLLNALRSNAINELTIYSCNGGKFVLSRAGMRRWWRRKKSLGSITEKN